MNEVKLIGRKGSRRFPGIGPVLGRKTTFTFNQDDQVHPHAGQATYNYEVELEKYCLIQRFCRLRTGRLPT